MDKTPRFFRTATEFRSWLKTHAARSPELLVGFHKVDTGRPSMKWPESVDEALCFGWIDGVRKRLDDHSYLIRFTPRRPDSIWSAVNIAKYGKLLAQGRVTPAGEVAYSHRKPGKSAVYAYEQPEVSSFSPEELRAFKRLKPAWEFFQASPPGYRKVVLHWITTAKKAQTRSARFATLVEACASGKRLR